MSDQTETKTPPLAPVGVDAMARPAFRPVLELAEQHRDRWRTKGEAYWLARLMQEVGELASATVGDHEDPPEYELRQIASICLNWLDCFYPNGRTPGMCGWPMNQRRS